MATDERLGVDCPKCERKSYFSKRTLCSQSGDFIRDKDAPAVPTKRYVKLFGTCYHCGYDFSQHKIQVDCEGCE